MFDLNYLQNISVVSAAAIPIVLAITQALKFKWIKDSYAPFVAMLVGIGVAFLLVHNVSTDISHTILAGILFGLSSSGVYSGLKSTSLAITQERIKAKTKRGE